MRICIIFERNEPAFLLLQQMNPVNDPNNINSQILIIEFCLEEEFFQAQLSNREYLQLQFLALRFYH